ncbi:MAG: NYN domain-containing protein [Moorea sp. SIO1G6]|nr:NYN domain-containing protein [Moorena sp. SIO1G6]
MYQKPFVNDSAAINEISLYLYQAILEVQQQQSELLKEKYRKIAWDKPRHQSAFLTKFKSELSQEQDWPRRIIKVRKLLQVLFIPGYFNSLSFRKLTQKLRHSIRPKPANNSHNLAVSTNNKTPTSVSPSPKLGTGIAILLLDAENLRLNSETEKFLAQICSYPIQIKIAVANWRAMGKYDTELHTRGYELIHVPPGKDSADFKMATVGASIFIHYPTAKEVLVCSSDGVMTHLCTTLQTHGLTVYLVRKQNDKIIVLNNKTRETQAHSLVSVPEIPTLEEFINQLKDILKAEQKRTSNAWINLSRLSYLFESKYQLTINQVVSLRLPGKLTTDIFSDYPKDFVTHHIPGTSNFYVTLFEKPISFIKKTSPLKTIQLKPTVKPLSKIESKSDLEEILVKLLKDLKTNYKDPYVPIAHIATEFKKQYSRPITQLMRDLNLKGTFPKFLQSLGAFKLKKVGKAYQVALRLDGLNALVIEH